MNEITSALKVVDTAIKTVKVIDIVKKATVIAAVTACGVFMFRFIRK